METSEQRLTYTISEVAKLLGLSRASTYALANSGGLPVLRLGRRIVVPKVCLTKLLAEASKGRKENGYGN